MIRRNAGNGEVHASSVQGHNSFHEEDAMADDRGGGGWLLLAVVIAGIAAYANGNIGSGSASSARSSSTSSLFSTSRCDGTGLLSLTRGNRGDNVADLQACLRKLGYANSAVDGIFGPRTRQAVIDFQRDQGLPRDGVVGAATRRALERAG
jgi:peptidoglycan hydrolase-like protein with peptidoglycan-binding domain